MQVFWITQFRGGRLAIMTRPRGGDWLVDDIATLTKGNVGAVVSCLTPPEEIELELRRERTECEAHGIRFFAFPIDDRGTPGSHDSVRKLTSDLNKVLGNDLAIAIHCRQGIGRSSMICASLMVSQGVSPVDAFTWLTNARGRPLPDTEEQRAWVLRFALDFQIKSTAT